MLACFRPWGGVSGELRNHSLCDLRDHSGVDLVWEMSEMVTQQAYWRTNHIHWRGIVLDALLTLWPVCAHYRPDGRVALVSADPAGEPDMNLERAQGADRAKFAALGLAEERVHDAYLDTEITPYLPLGITPGEVLTTIEVEVRDEAGLELSGRSQVITRDGVQRTVNLDDVYRDLPVSVAHFRLACEPIAEGC